MVNAVKKAMTMLMPIPARAFMPAGDLVDARHCASVFRTTGAIPNSIPFLYRRDTNRIRNTIMNLLVRVAHASRVSGEGVLAIANFCCGFNDTKSLFRRDAETNTRDACATRSRWRPQRFHIVKLKCRGAGVGWTDMSCCVTSRRTNDWRGENLFHCFWNSDDCRRSPWLREGGKHGFDHRRIDFGRAAFAGSVVDAGTSGRGIDYRTHCFTAAGGTIYSEIFPHLQSDAGGVDVGPERYRDYCRDCGLAEEIIACGSWGLARCAGSFSSFFLRSLSHSRCVGSHWNAGAGR